MIKNYLKAVFWDYPALCDPGSLSSTLKEARDNNDNSTLYWIMSRFLERGRVKDTATFFRLGEIRSNLPFLKLSSTARKRWERLMEVYANTD